MEAVEEQNLNHFINKTTYIHLRPTSVIAKVWIITASSLLYVMCYIKHINSELYLELCDHKPQTKLTSPPASFILQEEITK